MGMMGMFKWLRKDSTHRQRNSWNASPKQNGLNNEAYRHALKSFIDRRRFTTTDLTSAASLRSTSDLFARNKKNESINKENNELKSSERGKAVPGVPHVRASEIFEIGWVAGTEDRYLELIFAEWQNTRVSLKRHTHPECRDAIKADLDVLAEIRHPNVLLLMATTHTDDHGLVSIFESIDCTLYNYVHEQGERICLQGVARCCSKLADALRHSHMRGYIHGAISSHCVYLASSGSIKLGGWELANRVDKPNTEREYEERLRTEVYKWQAPEIFRGHEPSKKSDVYGLTLLIWEMCTMQVPWSGYSKAEVEKHYIQWKRGITTDFYDFPSLLNNLLETGLQLDETKRTLDMNSMKRFLQRFEMQYDEQELTYVTQYTNNNDKSSDTFVVPTAITSPTKVSSKPKCTNVNTPIPSITKHLFCSDKGSSSRIKDHFNSAKLTDNTEDKIHEANLHEYSTEVNDNQSDRMEQNTYVLADVQKNKNEIDDINCKLSSVNNVKNKLYCHRQSHNGAYKKAKMQKHFIRSANDTASTEPCSITDSMDEESFKEARISLKRLKESLAQKRQNFFSASDTSYLPDASLDDKAKIFDQTRSINYEPHKPASHKTSLEPKQPKSAGEYNSFLMNTSSRQPCKVADVSLQSQASPHSGNFFEESLWKREKEICISKMCKDFNSTYSSELATENCTGNNDKPQEEKMALADKNDTYVIDKESTGNSSKNCSEEHFSFIHDTADSHQSSLQVLKNALDRATDIIRSTTRSTENFSCSSFRSRDNIEPGIDDTQHCKHLFEDMYKIKYNDDEIKSIEKSPNGNEGFFTEDLSMQMAEKQNLTRDEQGLHQISTKYTKSKCSPFNSTRTRNFIHESIAEMSGESNVSATDSKFENNISNCSMEKRESTVHKENSYDICKTNYQTDDTPQNNLNASEESCQRSFTLMLFNDKSKDKSCNSCHYHKNALTRRRSLPAALGYFRAVNTSTTLGRLPIRKGDVPDNTVEDIYIDDEFGDSLNVNMILLNDESAIDDDSLPENLEL